EERKVELGMKLGELAEEAREDDAAGAGRRADLEGAGQRAGGLLGELRDDLLLEREQPLRGAVQLEPALRGLDAAAGPVEELRPEPFLERAHLETDGRLRHPEPLGRLRER